MGAMGFFVTVVTAMDWMTSIQLKNSPYFEYVVLNWSEYSALHTYLNAL